MHPASNHRKQLIIVATIDQEIENALTAKFDSMQFQLIFIRKGIRVAIELLEREADLLILDIDMEGSIAVDLIPLVRKLRPRLPIVLVSEDYTNRIHKMAAEQGVTYQTYKPQSCSNPYDLVNATEKILNRAGSLTMN
jgi:DNA-binding NtrC family response regulator